ncbi:MAG TPA: hypothetical protein VGO11_23570 [Chthoniobacteraceae bacterium]|jgi:hypothetical protein|nr:hypothetical protein [Chthoniobacteraceae bacterium]
MKPLGFAVNHRSGLRNLLLAALLAGGLGGAVQAEPPAGGRLPAFGTAGYQFNRASKDEHVVKGWLPKDWVDNSKWAAVNATYTKLDDPPEKGVGAVRIEGKNIDSGQLQLTTFEGDLKYFKGTKYVVTGWIRGTMNSTVKVGLRDEGEPKAFLEEIHLTGTPVWRPFELLFAPEKDCDALLMLVMRDPGTVDIAGLTVAEKK